MIALGYVALFTLPVGVLFHALNTRVAGLTHPTALDLAQLGRHLMLGDGWVTSILRPLSLAFHARYDHHPDLLNAPVHPILLALGFKAWGVSDRTVVLVGLVVWVATLWAVFGVARTWFRPRTAVLAGALFLGATSAFHAAIDGLPAGTAALFLLLAYWVGCPRPEVLEEPDSFEDPLDPYHPPGPPPVPPALEVRTEGWRLACAGVFCALSFLSDYHAIGFSVLLAAWLWRHSRNASQMLWWFLAGFALPVLPWMVALQVWTGSPAPQLFWYQIFFRTYEHPGATVFHIADMPGNPLAFAIRRPMQMGLKLVYGMGDMLTEAPHLLGWGAGGLFAASLLDSEQYRDWRSTRVLMLASAAAVGAFVCFFNGAPLALMPAIPLFSIAGARTLDVWLVGRYGQPAIVEEGETANPDIRFRLVHGVVAAVACIPLLGVLMVPPVDPLRYQSRLYPITVRVPANGVILTDQPELLAWYTGRKVMPLPRAEENFIALQRAISPVAASYVSPAAMSGPMLERSNWWGWLILPDGEYRGLVPTVPPLPDAVLRVRTGQGRL